MKDPTDYRQSLVGWTFPDDMVTPDNISRWHKGAVYHHFPDKRELRKRAGDAIAEGWLPEAPLISPQTRVLAIGSCFARNFTLWLAEHGFNRAFPDSPYNALLHFNADFESPAVVAQQFRWAFGEVDRASLLWIGKDRRIVEATEEGRREARESLEQTDVLIITLGLSEVWYDNATGEPLWRALTEQTFDPARHVFRVEGIAQTLEWLNTIERIRRAHLPRMKVIFTVSPIPLKTTFRPISAVTANSASKAIVRAALDEFLRDNSDVVNRELFYFPAYEFVASYFIDPFREDNRHLAPIVPGTIIAYFVRHFCSPEIARGNERESLASVSGGKMLERVMRHAAAAGGDAATAELLTRIAELEEDIEELREVCDARQKVIDELKEAADERLRLVNELHRAAAERLAVIESLDASLKAVSSGGARQP